MDDGEEEENVKNPFILCENIHKTYLIGIEGVAALRGVDLEIKKGEFLMICGTSGGGKSSLLNIIGTIDRPTKGRVTVCETTITPRTTDDELAKIRLHNLGFAFQTFNLLSSMTALENVELPLTFLGYNSSRRKEIATKLLQSVQMGDRLKHYPSMLSGGEQQRVTIARAMANSPGLLLLDEPTGDLDTLNTNNVMRLLINLNNKGTTLVMVTHDLNLVQYGTRIVYMRDGKISGQHICTPEDRAAKMAELEEQILMGRDGSKNTNTLSLRPGGDSSSVTNSSVSSAAVLKPSSPSTIFPSTSLSSLDPVCEFPTTTTTTSSSSSSSSSYSSSSSVVLPIREGGHGVIIPLCTSVREPGDYDPIGVADPALTAEVGYEIRVVDYPNVTRVRPFFENPYSNLRKEVVGVRSRAGQSSAGARAAATSSSRPSSKNSNHQNPDGSPAPSVQLAAPPSPSSTPSSILIPTPTPGVSGVTLTPPGSLVKPVDVDVQTTWRPSPDSPPS